MAHQRWNKREREKREHETGLQDIVHKIYMDPQMKNRFRSTNNKDMQRNQHRHRRRRRRRLRKVFSSFRVSKERINIFHIFVVAIIVVTCAFCL